MTPHERFAVEHFLCSYPKAFSYQDVLDKLREQASAGEIHMAFGEHHFEAWTHVLHVISLPADGHWLADEIETLREAIEVRFPHVTQYADEVPNPHAFSHLDTAALYAVAFEELIMEEAYPECFPGYRQEMPLDVAWKHFYHGGTVYENCRAKLAACLKEYADVETVPRHLLTPNVDYEEIAELCLSYWTEILNEHVDTECE